MEQQNDVWQVMVDGQVYETDIEGLIQWHVEGCFHPNDMVKKGNRSWIEAWKVPQLLRIFNGSINVSTTETSADSSSNNPQPYDADAQGYQQPTQSFNQNTSFDINNTNQYLPQIPTQTTVYNNGNYYAQPQTNGYHNQGHQNGWTAPPPPTNHVSENCINHPQIMPKYICRACSVLLCGDCPKKMGMSVFICPVCGAMCESYAQIKKKGDIAYRKNQGFGFEDLGQSLAYPFKFPASLIGGALLYAIFLFGGIIGYLFANMLLFGCIVVIIRQIAWGRMDRNFISEIGDNGFLDDLIKPGFLGIGVTLVSWGPMILGGVIAIYMAMTAAAGMLQQQNLPEHERQSYQLQAEPKARQFQDYSSQSERNFENPYDAEEKNFTEQRQKSVSNNYLNGILAAAIPLLLLIGIGALWGFFYYPMALAIAGYTQDFLATINPLVGFDTMKRMGGTYFKAFGMYVVVMIIKGALGFVVGIVTMPFNTPFGNIPGNLIGGAITFYSSMVIACLLGLALFKCSDKLGIETD